MKFRERIESAKAIPHQVSTVVTLVFVSLIVSVMTFIMTMVGVSRAH